MTPPPEPPGQWVTLALSLMLGLALVALLLFVLAPWAPSPPDLKKSQQLIATDAVTNSADALRPEPLERFLYVSGVLLLPFCLGAAYLGVRRFFSSARGQFVPWRFEPAALWLTTAVSLGLVLSAGLAEWHSTLQVFVPGGWYSLAAALALALAASTAAVGKFADRAGRLRWVLSASALGFLLLGTLAASVFREEHVRNIPIFWTSFNAVFYSVVQVFLGRELTVDFVNQYGLYPHFLEPVFRLVGLSLFTFTFLMGLLNCLSFACLYLFLARETRSALMASLGTASAFFFCYSYGRAVLQPDYFFQYYPLRTIFPAVLLVIGQAYAHEPRAWMPAAVGSLGAAAALWTPDVGVIVLASGLLFLGYDSLARRRPREIPRRLLQATAAAGGVFLLFSLFLRLRYGSFPDYARLFLYPKAFLVYGASLLPMPRFGFWVPVLVVYALGLLRSLVPLVEAKDRPRDRLCFLLSVLGFGLFVYYQGRSVVWNLSAAAYPALLLLALFADDLRATGARGGPAARRVLGVTILTLLFFSVPALAIITPAWVRSIAAKIEVTRRRESTDVLRDIRFLQQLVRPGEKVVIMSYQSGLLHLMTRTINPLDIPGDSELAYRADFDKQSAYVLGRRGKSVVDKTTMNPPFIYRVRALYRNRVENPSGNLIVLQVP